MINDKPWYTELFQLNQTGFLVLSFMIIISIIVGILVLILKSIIGRISSKKIMLFGGELILLGYIFTTIADFQLRFPSLSFITILLGVIISIYGLIKED
ncbi:hypothetical protein [Paenibacillus lemnae]|uniref:Uncharacterized protein n=1 Tax=Paenibacillus lemnae TaxID=1330551 RepID=A0A848MFJ5_PAELE|nr:hypothetical protein [Paenibacillus lemnae]NMO98194.1 hypothetical protein [Paenibacillus lemnae]